MAEARVVCGDCIDLRSMLADGERPHLIVTSPPYAMRRRKQYGGVPAAQYPKWFCERADVFRSVLAEDGSMVVNIKEHCEAGERSDYVLRLILALRESGWRWVEEYAWMKKNPAPGKWPSRFRDGWERLLHFSLVPKFKMRQESVMTPAGRRTRERVRQLRPEDRVRSQSSTGSGVGRRMAAWVGRDMVFPSNVIAAPTSDGNTHPAAFPAQIPDFFVRLLSDPGDLIVDPFAGSGTTLAAAAALGRRAIGVDIRPEYCDLMRARLSAPERVRA